MRIHDTFDAISTNDFGNRYALLTCFVHLFRLLSSLNVLKFTNRPHQFTLKLYEADDTWMMVYTHRSRFMRMQELMHGERRRGGGVPLGDETLYSFC